MIAYFFLWYYTDPVPLLGIGILDEYQGKGFGKKLIQFLIDAARRSSRDGIDPNYVAGQPSHIRAV